MDDEAYSATNWEADQLCWRTLHLDEKRAIRRTGIHALRDGQNKGDEGARKTDEYQTPIVNGSLHMISMS
jgi:hypothetical protein